MIECPQCEAQLRGPRCACGYKVEQSGHRKIFKPIERDIKVRPGLIRACSALLNKRFNHEITTFELIEAMHELEKEYPGAGFAPVAREMLEEWEEKQKQR